MSASTSAAATKEAAEDRNGSSSRSYYRDHHVRPPYSYADLLKQALDPSTGATTKSLTEIYDWIEANYAYYRGVCAHHVASSAVPPWEHLRNRDESSSTGRHRRNAWPRDSGCLGGVLWCLRVALTLPGSWFTDM